MKKSFFFKGIIMGICDTVPGISGGTIAFITGIYQRLIESIKAFSPKAITNATALLIRKGSKEQFKKDYERADLGFLIPLVAGIGVAIILFSHLIEFLLDGYYLFVMAFFIGLILSSAITLFTHIEKHHTTNQLMALLGLALGIALAFMVPTTLTPTPFFIILSGAIAISAMILPGISGSFILLIMGMYETIISAISNMPETIPTLLLFGLGAIIGLMSITRIVSYIFHKNKCMTLYTLVGLVVGALSVPLRDIITEAATISTSDWVILVVLAIIGALGATAIAKKGKASK